MIFLLSFDTPIVKVVVILQIIALCLISYHFGKKKGKKQ